MTSYVKIFPSFKTLPYMHLYWLIALPFLCMTSDEPQVLNPLPHETNFT
jgi:hypothetical protein